MKKAYLLIVHKNPIQINILLKQLLEDEESDIYVHVNKLNDKLKADLLDHDRITILKNNINVYWGTESINEVLILLLKEAINSEKDYEYFSFRTGQDLQIRRGVDKFLVENDRKIFINPKHIKKTHIYYGHFSVKCH